MYHEYCLFVPLQIPTVQLFYQCITNKEKILEGTGWLKVSQTPKQYDAFANIPETKEKKKLKLVGKKTNKKLRKNTKTKKKKD